MRATVGIRNRVCERQNLVVVAVVVLQHNIDKDFVTLSRNHDRLRMEHLLVFAKLPYEFLNAVLVEKRFFLRGLGRVRR